MAKVLSVEIHKQIYDSLKSNFSDFPQFQDVVGPKLWQAIMDSNNVEINVKTTRKVVERYFAVDVFKTKDQKAALAQIQLIFKCCYTMLLSNHETSKLLMWNSIDTLLENYPQFHGQDQQELQYLLNFRNMMKIALIIIPPRLNKQCLLKIAARLEGSQNEYVTGGGQKPAVTRRVEIYECEGNVEAEKRPERPQSLKVVAVKNDDESSGGAKRKSESTVASSSARHSKLTRLKSADIREILEHSDPVDIIPPMYQTNKHSAQHIPFAPQEPYESVSQQGKQQEVVDSLQALLDLKRPQNHHNSFSTTKPASIPVVAVPVGINRDNTDMLISSCALLSSSSDLWNETLAHYTSEENLKEIAEHGVVSHNPFVTATATAIATAANTSSNSGASCGGNVYITNNYMLSTDGDFWKESLAATRPAQIARSISYDIYNGSLTEDLRSLL